MSRKAGFTLIEMLTTLLIMAIILGLFLTRAPQDLSANIQTRQTLDLITRSLKEGQQTAILQGNSLTVSFAKTNRLVLIQNNQHEVARIHLPQHLELANSYHFVYQPNGSISGFKTVTFIDNQQNKKYYLVFQLGNGQFEIQT